MLRSTHDGHLFDNNLLHISFASNERSICRFAVYMLSQQYRTACEHKGFYHIRWQQRRDWPRRVI